MKKFLTLLIISGVLVGAFYLVGTVVPRMRSTSCRVTLKSDPNKVFAVLADVERWPDWNPTVVRVEPAREQDGHPVWTLTDPEQRTTKLEVGLIDGPHKLGATFEVEGARGSVRYELKWYGGGSIVRVTEQRDVRDPWRRAARLFQDQYSGLTGTLEGLARKLGESVTAEKL